MTSKCCLTVAMKLRKNHRCKHNAGKIFKESLAKIKAVSENTRGRNGAWMTSSVAIFERDRWKKTAMNII
jgi:hypothetical protein